MKYLACATAISLAALFPVAAGAATYTVPADDSVTASASGTYDVVEVEGSLTVPSGVTLSGTANYIGRTSAATLAVESGGIFGVEPASPFAELSIGDSGGKAKIAVRGGTFRNGHTYIRKDTAVDDSGHIDFLEIDGTSTLTCRNFYNYSSTPARTRILSGVATFTSAGGASYHHYITGSWVIDVAEGAKALFHRAYRNYEALTDNANVNLTFTGAGDVEFTGANNNVFSIASGTAFNHSGYIYNTARPIAFADGVVFGDSVKGFSTTGTVTLQDETTYYVSVAGISVEFGRDYAFSHGILKTGENTSVDLRGHCQRFTTVEGAGTVVSTESPAVVEVATLDGSTATNLLRFAGSSGLKMVGGGTLVAKGASTTTGGVEVTSGTLRMAVSWPNATTATVSGSGVLELVSAKAFPRSIVLSLSGTGGIELPAGSVLRVAELRLTDPSTGICTTYKTGAFTAANSYGLVSAGRVEVGKQGLMLIYR